MDGSKRNKNSGDKQKGHVEVTEKLTKDHPSYLTEIDNMKSLTEDVQSTNKFIGNMTSVIQDVQTTSQVILQRLGDTMSNMEQKCTCKCHTIEKSSEVEDIKTRLIKLEKSEHIKHDKLEQLEEQLKYLVASVSDIQRNQTRRVDDSAEEDSVGEDVNETETKSEPESDKASLDADMVKKDNEASNSAKNGSGQDINTLDTDDAQQNQKANESPPVTGDKVTDDSARSQERVEMIQEKVEFVSDEEAQGSDYISTLQAKREAQAEEAKVSDSSSKEAASGNPRTSAASFIANFTAKPSMELRETTVSTSGTFPGRILHQTESKYVRDLEVWKTMAGHEQNCAQAAGFKSLGGVHSVICVDISASIAEGNGWEQTTKFCHDYFNGLAKMAREHDITEEHVALVTFGHKCEVAKRLTNNMNDLLKTFDSLQLGGPSPLYGGFWMAYSAAVSSQKTSAFVNGIHVHTKIIMITDGRPSDATMYAGPDVETTRKKDETMASIMHIVDVVQNNRVDICYVPVGNANMEFFDSIKVVGDCKFLSYKDGLKTSRRLYLTLQLQTGDLFGLLGSQSSFQSHMGLSEEDKEVMAEIRQEGQKNMFQDFLTKTDKNKYVESKSDILPPIGTRVRRGPDWSWNNQDSNGPGTVIGHDDSLQIWVHWDADDHMNIYSYCGVKYDVLIVDEPRIIGHRDRLQVGCVVKPGKNWDTSDLRVKSFDRGIVIKLLLDGSKVEVRWDDGHRGDYTYDVNGKQEVQYCIPDESWPRQGGHVLGGESVKIPKNKNKNKNKNNP